MRLSFSFNSVNRKPGCQADSECDTCCEAVEAEQEGRCVGDLLEAEYALVTGGLAKDQRPIITLPDHANFHTLTQAEYQRLLLYLTSVPTLLEADMGFHIVIDRRKDRWHSVKTALATVSECFPGSIEAVYVLRPVGFLQKALSEVSNKLFKEEFRFKVVVCSTLDELHEYIDKSQLTEEFGGSLEYSHDDWIHQRLALEQFTFSVRDISNELEDFTKDITKCEESSDLEQIQQQLTEQESRYNILKSNLKSAIEQGEALLEVFRKNSFTNNTIGHVAAVERLILQIDETEKQFDYFWGNHSTKQGHWLKLQTFLLNFKEIQSTLENRWKEVMNMTEIGESSSRVDTLIEEAKLFQEDCKKDIEKADKIIEEGEHLKIDPLTPENCIETKCEELKKLQKSIQEQIETRYQVLAKVKDLVDIVEKANAWCASGVELLSREGSGLAVTEALFSEAQLFGLKSPTKFKETLLAETTAETKALVTQVCQRVEDVWVMVKARRTALQRVERSSSRPVLHVSPHVQAITNRTKSLPIMETSGSSESSGTSNDDAEALKAKRGHVLAELLHTERLYVQELGSVLKGYKEEIEKPENIAVVPPMLIGKSEVLFGNLQELFNFHSDIFLKDLENCISTAELVALCFVQKRDTFFRLYSYYCQNIPRSERLREALVDTHLFLQACQLKLGHKLPLAAYLLKPVQRITKYQLLLRDLLRYSEPGTDNKALQEALDCMLVVLKCVNDSMHQIAITGFPVDLKEQGELLMQGSFMVLSETKRDLRLRSKSRHRHVFLYEKAMLFCKPAAKNSHNKATYHFKHDLLMSQIGLTECVKGDTRKFEVWRQGRSEVHTLTAPSAESRQAWVACIKKLLLLQLHELKGEKVKQYAQRNITPPANAWETPGAGSSDAESDEEEFQAPARGAPLVALADYCAVGASELSLKEGDIAELLKVGCSGWWYIRMTGKTDGGEGWAPAAYLELRKTSRSSSQSYDHKIHH